MITIAERLRPFCHLPGSCCLIPRTSLVVEAFPARVVIKELTGRVIREIELPLPAPLKYFTLMQDLERGCVTLFSDHYRFHITQNAELVYGKSPSTIPLPNRERISFGNHKKQDWEQIRKRLSMREVFPIWFRLGSLLQLPSRKGADCGLFSLLAVLRMAIDDHKPEVLIPHFEKLFLSAFHSMLVPWSFDAHYQGLLKADAGEISDSPLYFLSEGSSLIRSLLLVSAENEISLLPNLPPELFAGRMVNMRCAPFGYLDLEWRQKKIRQMRFVAEKDGAILFHFPPSLRSCRLRLGLKEKARPFSCGDLLEIKSGSTYLLDRFEK